MPKMILDWKTANDFITDAFVGAGVPREDALICTDVLLESDRRGIHSLSWQRTQGTCRPGELGRNI